MILTAIILFVAIFIISALGSFGINEANIRLKQRKLVK
jgi:hypothetical protein